MYCKTPLSKKTGQLNCPKCKMLNLPGASETTPEVMRLSDAAVSTVKRINVGFLNKIFGGGLAETSVNLIAGPPGAGKTTLFLQLADLVLGEVQTGEVLYIANEQSPAELKDTAIRLGIEHKDRIFILDAMGGLRRDLGSILIEYKPRLVILDSLTKMISEDQPEAAVFFVERFKEYTVSLKAPTLIVNQVNKGGEHAGLNRVLHAGDALFYLDKDDHTGKREFYSTKNRFGEAPISQFLWMMPSESERPGYLVPAEEEEENGEE